MTPLELLARREGLGLSQASLAGVLGNGQNTISQWEHGRRRIPDGLDGELAEVEEWLEDLADRMLDACEQVHEAGEPPSIISYRDDRAFWAAHPEWDGMPSELHRVAAARAVVAARDEGIEVTILPMPG